MSAVDLSRPAAKQLSSSEGDHFQRVMDRVAARKRHEVEMHVAAVVRHAQVRATLSRPASVPCAQPSEEALQARLASAAQAAALRAAQVVSDGDVGGSLFSDGGDHHATAAQGVAHAGARLQAVPPASAPRAASVNLQAQAAAALEAAKRRATRPADVGTLPPQAATGSPAPHAAAKADFQKQAATALEAAKQRAARPAGVGVTPVSVADLEARARRAAGEARERQRFVAYEHSVEAQIHLAMAAAAFRSATEDIDDEHREEEDDKEKEEAAFGNGNNAAEGLASRKKVKFVDEEIEVESPRKNFGGC